MEGDANKPFQHLEVSSGHMAHPIWKSMVALPEKYRYQRSEVSQIPTSHPVATTCSTSFLWSLPSVFSILWSH